MEHKALEEFDLTTEVYREYDFNGRVYRINHPVKLFLKRGSSTHRVLDNSGVVHCVPTPGVGDCVLRWQSKDVNKPVDF